MSLDSGCGRLRRASQDLAGAWSKVRTVWHDDNSARFEQRVLGPLLARLHTVEKAMAHMNEVVSRARRDCE